jgi:2-aminoadipate transaminase
MLELFKTLKLDKDNKTALYIQLYNKLKELIKEGVLPKDLKLPSIRNLSDILDVNQVTVVSAIKLLLKDNYVYVRAGSGTFVANILALTDLSPKNDNSIILDELYQNDDLSLINSGQINISKYTINFASATPSPDLFPVEDFKLVLNEVLERDKGNAFGYQESQGFLPLRESISEILKNYGIDCSSGSIQIISGAQQGIDIISKAFLNPGDYIITESPTYTGAIAVFKSRGAEIADLEINEDGPSINVLEYNLKKFRPKLMYTIPSFQNPTGFSYSNRKREEILALAEKYNTYIIEDDYVSDLDFENKNYRSFKSMDKNNRVIYIKSFSKIFMPGLRLGFMISPLNMQGNILEAKHTTDISTSGLLQRAFDLYIRKGYWDKHIKFMYSVYRERYFKIIEALDINLQSVIQYYKPGGGLNIWLNLPYGFPANTLFKNASARDVVFAPGKIFYSNNLTGANSIRLSFAAVDKDQIESGVEKLCDIMATLNQNHEGRINVPIL